MRWERARLSDGNSNPEEMSDPCGGVYIFFFNIETLLRYSSPI